MTNDPVTNAPLTDDRASIGPMTIGPMTNDNKTNGPMANDCVTKDGEANDREANDCVTNDCVTNDRGANDREANSPLTNSCLTNDPKTNDPMTNDPMTNAPPMTDTSITAAETAARMTTGPATVSLTHRRILTIAIPIVLSNATVPLLGAMDTAVIGHLGQAAPIGAVGLGATILTTLYWAFGFLRMSTSGLAAQAKGARDPVELSATLIRALLMGAAAGLTLIALHPFLFSLAFQIVPASPQVESLALTFLNIRIWAAPATIGLYAITGYLVGTEHTRAILVLQLWQNGLNMALDLWFVIGLGWGVAGVGTASLLAEVTGLALGLYLTREALVPLRAALIRLADPQAIRRTFSASRDILIRTVILQLSFTSFVFISARFGDASLAANAVLLQFLGIMAYALDGFAFAAESLVGQAIGAKDPAALKRAARMAMQWGYGGALLLAISFAVGGYAAIQVMTNVQAVQSQALALLPWLIAAPLISSAAWTYDGIFIGALMTHSMRNAAIQVAGLYAAALAILVPSFGNQGLWAALMLMNAARGLTLRRAFPQILARAEA